jgi:hypothetical protein
MEPLSFWKPGTKVRLRTNGAEGTVEACLSDGFYAVVLEQPDSIERIAVHVEDLELVE